MAPVSRKHWTGLLALCLLLIADPVQADNQASWVVDRTVPGPSIPPAGRSLFDRLFLKPADGGRAYVLPFPFAALLAHIEQQLESGERKPYQAALIPLGRSLQRFAADPDYFDYPRAIVAFDSKQSSRDGTLYLRDRRFMGYSEAAGVIEVISYNEDAGRFEFQIVEDYREDETPRVSYMDRPVCLACHQNHAPLFSRPEWDETNASPGIAALLAETGRAFYGIPIRIGIDTANRIDDATDRANRLSLVQELWQRGCGSAGAGAACRTALVIAALRYRLSGRRHGSETKVPERSDAAARLTEQWSRLWPHGLAIPNPDIPNRAPVRPGEGPPGDARERIRATGILSPAHPRPPLTVWPTLNDELARQLVQDVGEFLSDRDIRDLDRRLAEADNGTTAPLVSPCRVRRVAVREEYELELRCRPPLALEGHVQLDGTRVTGGRLRHLQLGEHTPLPGLLVQAGELTASGDTMAVRLSLREAAAGLHARLADGNRLGDLTVNWRHQNEGSSEGEAHMATGRDFRQLAERLQAAAGEPGSEPGPLQRSQLLASLYKALDQPLPQWIRTPWEPSGPISLHSGSGTAPE